MNGEKELAVAEAELVKARQELAEAVSDIASAEQKIEEVIDRDRPFKVKITYNGVTKSLEARYDELVKTLLNKAINVFGPIPQPHTLSLFNAAGDELDDNKTLEASGVKPDDTLLLRPSKVKGGA